MTARQRAEADMLGCLPPDLVKAHLDAVEAAVRASLAALVSRLYRASNRVHTAYDGECEHGFGPPATKCSNEDCPDRELAEAWNDLLSLARGNPDGDT